MQKSSSKLLSPTLITTVAVILLACSGYLWWVNIYNAPRNVFESMLNNSLQLHGVTRNVVQGGQQQSTSQISQLSLVPVPTVRAETTLYQMPDTTVQTESVGTPYEDYVRYTNIDTNQPNLEGEQIDFGSILNVWGQQNSGLVGVMPDGTNQTDGELFAEAVLGVVPFGRLNANDRQEIVSLMMDDRVYQIDYDNVVREVQDGRPQYIYEVEIDPEAYISMLQNFGERVGLNSLQDLDPAAYAGAPGLPFTLAVDLWSRQLVQVTHSQSGRTETLSGHNASRPVEMPDRTETITVQELQERLQSLQ